MPIIKNKISVFPVRDVLFEFESNAGNMISFKKYRHLDNSIKKPVFTIKRAESTLYIDLTNNSNEEIKRNFRNNYRSDIKKAGEMDINCKFGNYVHEFYAVYLLLHKNKKLPVLSKSIFESIMEYAYFSIAILNDEILCAHCHIFNKERNHIRLLASASNRFCDNINKNVIAAANKLLTAEDISFFKNEGFHIYDFGGFAVGKVDQEMEGINRFKKGFGGNILKLNSYTTLPYFLLEKLSYIKSNFLKKTNE